MIPVILIHLILGVGILTFQIVLVIMNFIVLGKKLVKLMRRLQQVLMHYVDIIENHRFLMKILQTEVQIFQLSHKLKCPDNVSFGGNWATSYNGKAC